MAATLALTLEFHPLARRPDRRYIWRNWAIHLVVDGHDHVFEEGPYHQIEVAPGPHQIEVYFTGVGALFLAGLLGIRYGRKALSVDLADGGLTTLSYRGGIFWTITGGELTVASRA